MIIFYCVVTCDVLCCFATQGCLLTGVNIENIEINIILCVYVYDICVYRVCVITWIPSILVGVSDADRAAVAHVGYLDGRRVGDTESGRWRGRRGVREGGGWMGEVSRVGDRRRVGHADIGFARAGEWRVNGLSLRGYLCQITVAAQNVVGR